MPHRAIGLIHLGVAERNTARDTIERLATDHGHHLVGILTVDGDTYMPTTLIVGTAADARATVIITPDLDHLGAGYKAIPRTCAVLLPGGRVTPPPRQH